MPFHIKRIPAAAKHVIAAYLETEVAKQSLRSLMAQGNEKPVKLSFLHEAYALGIDQLAQGVPLTAAIATATRIVVATGEQQVLAVLEIKKKDESAEVGVETGNSLKRFLEALGYIEKMPVYSEQQAWELRLLRCEPLGFSAIWLHHPAGGADALLLLSKVSAVGKSGEIYREAALLRKLQKAALRQMELNYVAVLQQRLALEQERIVLEQARIQVEQGRIRAENEPTGRGLGGKKPKRPAPTQK
jgi:hypothetical protein